MSVLGFATSLSYAEPDRLRSVVSRIIDSVEAVDAALRAADDSTSIVLKPNWIQEKSERQPSDWLPLITHPAVIEAVLEEILERTEGRGTITLCDAPHTYARFDSIVDLGGLRNRVGQMRREHNASISFLDLRRETWDFVDGVVAERRPNPHDPRGYVETDLGRASRFFGHRGEGRYYGADYDTRVVNFHHVGTTQRYLIAGTVQLADVLINLPKFKTHKKTGITGALKNMVGANGDKNWLPHHTMGFPGNGGDEFQSRRQYLLEGKLKRGLQALATRAPALGTALLRNVKQVASRPNALQSNNAIRNGNWIGNDTCWRMAHDLNDAIVSNRPERPYLAIVDGIIAGEGDGPLDPVGAAAGVVVYGDDPWEVDTLLAQLAGFSLDRLPGMWSTELWAKRLFDDRDEHLDLRSIEPILGRPFLPHHGWKPVVK